MKIELSVLWKGIKELVYKDFTENPGTYLKMKEIRDYLLEENAMLNLWPVVMKLAHGGGINEKIRFSIQDLKDDGVTILTSDKRGQGYIYLPYDDPNAAKYFDSKFRANRTRRDIARLEKENDRELFGSYLEHCTISPIRNQLKQVAIKHRVKRTANS